MCINACVSQIDLKIYIGCTSFVIVPLLKGEANLRQSCVTLIKCCCCVLCEISDLGAGVQYDIHEINKYHIFIQMLVQNYLRIYVHAQLDKTRPTVHKTWGKNWLRHIPLVMNVHLFLPITFFYSSLLSVFFGYHS